jgi:hypothetical protein
MISAAPLDAPSREWRNFFMGKTCHRVRRLLGAIEITNQLKVQLAVKPVPVGEPPKRMGLEGGGE